MACLKFFAAMAMLVRCACAATMTVGSPNGGWDLSTDLSSWASSQNFSIGDTLVFRYDSTHDVLEVTKSSYDACRNANSIASHSNGNTTIALTTPGRHYFICGLSNHCTRGMKMEIDVIASSTGAPPSSDTPRSNPNSPSPPLSNLAFRGFRAPMTTGVLFMMLVLVVV